MIQIYPDSGLVEMLLRIVANDGAGLTWALFQNDVEPDLDTNLADLTLADAGWGQTVLDETDFTLSQVALHIGTIQGSAIVFVNTTGVDQDVYGYAVFDQVGGKLFAVARFDVAPQTIAPAGNVSVLPIFGDYSDVLIPVIDGGTF